MAELEKKRRGIIGLKGIVLSPIIQDTVLAYESSGGNDVIALPYVTALNRTPQITSQDFYGDDQPYAQVSEYMGDDVEMRFLEMQLDVLDTLGLGDYNAVTGVFKSNLSVPGRKYSLRCITNTIDDLPLYFNYRVFDLNSIRYDNFATKGSSIAICEVIIEGRIMQPAMASVEGRVILQVLPDLSNQDAADDFLREAEVFPVI